MGGMGIPRIKAPQDFLLGHFACGVCRLPISDLVLHPLGAIPAQLLDDRAGVGQVAMESKKINTVPQRENGGFLVQLKAVTVHERPNIPENALQFLLVRTDDVEIIHVSAIVFDAVLFFDDVVELVQKHEGEKLARLVAQRQAVLHHVDVDAKQLIDTRVNAALVQHGFELAF